MSWTKTRHQRVADPAGKPWTTDAVESFVAAISRAPSVHNTRPWELEVQGRRAELWQRSDVTLSRHDPEGRDRRISCGAALANLVLAIRNAGWAADVRWAESSDPPELVATVVGTAHQKPTATEGQRYRAINRRTSYRKPLEDRPVPHSTRETVRAAAASPAVHARWVMGGEEALTLARLLTYAASVHRDDRRYQQELDVWTVEEEEEPGPGIPVEALGTEGVAAVGLATSQTRVPDEGNLAARIEAESVLILSTNHDDHSAHFRAGVAMELAWLAATSLGLAVSVSTQPLQLSEVRRGLTDGLSLPGVPEIMMRFGYPSAEVSDGSGQSTSGPSAAQDSSAVTTGFDSLGS